MTQPRDHLAQLRSLLQQPPDPSLWEKFAFVLRRLSGADAPDWGAVLGHLLRQRPGPELWEAICELFVAWPHSQARSEALADAAQQLDAWDDTLRVRFANWAPLCDRGPIADIGLLVRWLRMYRIDEQATALLRAVAGSPYLQRLTWLSIERCEEIDPEAFGTLAHSPYLRSLQHLEIHRSDLGVGASFHHQAPSATADELRWLAPTPMRVYFFDLMRSPVVANLRRLRLTSLGLTDWYVAVLAQSAFAPRLEHLDLGDNYLGDTGVQILAESPCFRNLTSLGLAYSRMGDAGVQSLVRSPVLHRLGELDLRRIDIKPAARQALRSAPYLRGTTILFD